MRTLLFLLFLSCGGKVVTYNHKLPDGRCRFVETDKDSYVVREWIGKCPLGLP